MAYSPPATADTETCSEADAMVAVSAPPSGVRRRVVVVTSGVVGAMAAVAVAATLTSAPEADSSSVSQVLSAASSKAVHRMGCSNWREIQINGQSNSNASLCKTQCENTRGCHAYNLQMPGKCVAGDGKEANYCYTFGEGCKEEVNNCWDLYYLVPPNKGWDESPTARMGCANWKDIIINEVPDVNEDQCGNACSNEPNCEQFNYQVAQMDSCPGTKKVGTCYLFGGNCTRKANDCWDLFDKAGTTTSSPAGSTTA